MNEPDRTRVPARPRGNLWVYGSAFVVVVVSAYAQFRGNVDSSLPLVWTSIGLSGLALVAAVLSLVLPASGTRPPGGETAAEPATEAAAPPEG